MRPPAVVFALASRPPPRRSPSRRCRPSWCAATRRRRPTRAWPSMHVRSTRSAIPRSAATTSRPAPGPAAGPATRRSSPHLNSCAPVGTELVCASSNYPAHADDQHRRGVRPGQADHLRSIPLGHQAGSLTWVLRKDKAWWAAFANYDGKGRRARPRPQLHGAGEVRRRLEAPGPVELPQERAGPPSRRAAPRAESGAPTACSTSAATTCRRSMSCACLRPEPCWSTWRPSPRPSRARPSPSTPPTLAPCTASAARNGRSWPPRLPDLGSLNEPSIAVARGAGRARRAGPGRAPADPDLLDHLDRAGGDADGGVDALPEGHGKGHGPDREALFRQQLQRHDRGDALQADRHGLVHQPLRPGGGAPRRRAGVRAHHQAQRRRRRLPGGDHRQEGVRRHPRQTAQVRQVAGLRMGDQKSTSGTWRP